MKLVTYCDKPQHEGLAMFRHSCEVHGWEPILIGEGNRRFSWEIRLCAMRDFCRSLSADELVLFTDCFDVLLCAGPDVVEAAFDEIDHPLVISAERNCWPLENIKRLYPLSPTSFRFVCAGTYIGAAGAILTMMEEIGVDYLENCADQIELGLWYSRQRKKATLDYHCKIFQCYFMAEDVVGVRDGCLFNSETKTNPLVLHANGNHGNRQTARFYQQLFSK